MSQRRMFSPDIVESDEFMTMPVSSQALYFHLGMHADDDGFVQPRVIIRAGGFAEDDLKVLLAKRFLLAFETGVVVIKHWLIHNLIRSDRYKETRFIEEKKRLTVKENRAYTDSKQLGCQNDNQRLPQVRLGKVKLREVNNSRFTPPTYEEVKKYCDERSNSVDAQKFVDFYESKGWLVGKVKMKSWQACVRTWEKTSKPTEEQLNAEKELKRKEYEEKFFKEHGYYPIR